MEIKMKLLVILLMNFPLIVLTKNLELSDVNNSQIKNNASTNAINHKSLDTNLTNPINSKQNEKLQYDVEFSAMVMETTTDPETTSPLPIPTTTTEDPKSILIPPAFVDAQIEKVNISSNNVSKQQEA